jgi:tRNA-specific 2-thiouridylase
MEHGFDAVATGHYAKSNSIGELFIPKDTHKDQTYFLYLLSNEQLKHVVFPLADLTKTEVRTLANERDIHVASKPDSVGICFIGDINVHAFLKERLGEKPGEVVDMKGNVIGKHNGLWFYTIGQRHGFDIDKKTAYLQADGQTIEKENFPPFYVVCKDAAKNQLVVGFGADTLQQEFKVINTHWIAGTQPTKLTDLKVRIRHTGALLPCEHQMNKSTGFVELLSPTQGIAEGQAAVFYQSNAANELTCLGGGTIALD